MARLRGGLSLKLESDLCSLAYTLLTLPHPLLQKQHSSDLPLQVLASLASSSLGYLSWDSVSHEREGDVGRGSAW